MKANHTKEEQKKGKRSLKEWNIEQYFNDDKKKKKFECPYLGRIRRDLLDFDFEKVCSVTLSNQNVYCCLCCGQYFQGRGKHTPAYTHSLEAEHHLFISFQEQNIYCLPDNYEVVDASLFDIKYNLNPVFSPEQISQLDEQVLYSKTLEGEDFMPGFVGLNNLKQTDYVNVVLQVINRIRPIRNYFLTYKDDSEIRFDLNGILTQRLAELVRKVWNPRNFKGHVNPHEVMQAISGASHKTFKIGEQKDPVMLLSWLLNSLHSYIYTKKKSNIIADTLRGQLQIRTEPLIGRREAVTKPSQTEKPFWMLSIDLPSVPLYKGETGVLLTIPQTTLEEVMKKYDGKTFTDDTRAGIRSTFKILKLPKYLILAVKRFVKNDFFMEKNNTVILFPLKDIDLGNYVEKKEPGKSYKYSVVAQVIHDGKPESGTYKVQVLQKVTGQWIEIQDLNVVPIMEQMVSLSETYILVLEMQQ